MLPALKGHTPAYRYLIGNREVVGPSFTGREEYYDRPEHPNPAIRFKEPTPETEALREKEKGNWKSLSIADKKRLYRYSYCQTFAEMLAPRYEARRVIGTVLIAMSIPIAIWGILKATVFPPLPDSFSDQRKKELVRYYIDSRAEPLHGGIASKWDYEKNEWKERPYFLMKSK